MNHADAIEFLYGLQLFGARFGLEATRRLAELAGNPQNRLRFIHVAGTNGKGSVCAMLESVYRAAGFRTGLYTSPHLVRFGERIQVNRRLVPEADITQLVRRMQDLLLAGAGRGWWDPPPGVPPGPEGTTAVKQAKGLGHPTFFEVVTVMALLHFAESECEVVLWETGLGGRFDATNIVTPLASVITNVSHEHGAYLGDTITKIAAEKSGIIKPGISVVTGTTDPEVLRVIGEVAGSRNAPLVIAGAAHGADAPRLDWVPDGYQQNNAHVALATIETLQARLPVPPRAIETGLRTFEWPGRLHRVERDGCRCLIDGAHNPAGMRQLRATLTSRPGWHPCPVIFGTFNDKDVPAVLGELLPLASRILVVPLKSPRSADPKAVLARAMRLRPDLPGEVSDSLSAALKRLSGTRDILVTGSLFLAGEALEVLGATPAGSSAGEQQLNDWTRPANR